MSKEYMKDEEDCERVEDALNNSQKIIFDSSDIKETLDDNPGKINIEFLKKLGKRDKYQVYILENDPDLIITTEPYLEEYNQGIFLDTEEAYRKAVKTVQQLEEMPESDIHKIGNRYIPSELTTVPRTHRKGSIGSLLQANPNIKHNKVENQYEWKK